MRRNSFLDTLKSEGVKGAKHLQATCRTVLINKTIVFTIVSSEIAASCLLGQL